MHCGLSTASDAAAATSWSLVLYHRQNPSPLLTAAITSCFLPLLLELLLGASDYLSRALLFLFLSRIFASRYLSLPRSIPNIKISPAPPSSFFCSSQLHPRTAFTLSHQFFINYRRGGYALTSSFWPAITAHSRFILTIPSIYNTALLASCHCEKRERTVQSENISLL